MSRWRSIGRRGARRLRHALAATRAWVVHHPGYQVALPGIPVDPIRAERIAAYLYDRGLIGRGDVSRPIPASLDNMRRVHSDAYLESLDRPEILEAVLGFSVAGPARQQLIDYQRLLTGGTIQATRLALRTGRPALNLGGGLHHASPDGGMGFCLFNDIAVAITRLRTKGFDEPVLVVDLDLHDGNGTRVAFAADPTVFTFSIHNETWDSVEATADRYIALGAGVADRRYLETLKAELPRVFRAHRPGLVVYVAGTDPAADDAVGNWKISESGMLDRDRFVVELIRGARPRPPLVVLLGGGYGERAWRYSARFFAWLLSGTEHDPTEDVDAVVRRYQRAMGEEQGSAGAEDLSALDWSLGEEDLGALQPGTGQTRVLGAMSRHAVELSLERVGILDQIRALGFTGIRVEVQATPPLGHTIRLFGGPGELLMEQRISRQRSAVPGMNLLYAEWLLLQNPRAEFSEARRPLPGQERPGLGLMREVVAWWLALCKELRLDGILFVPSHYYMAALGRRHLLFLRAEDAAAFDAIESAVAGLDLGWTRAIEAGRVVNARDGGKVSWPNPPMVLPVSESLRARVAGPAYDEVYRRTRERLTFRIATEAPSGKGRQAGEGP